MRLQVTHWSFIFNVQGWPNLLTLVSENNKIDVFKAAIVISYTQSFPMLIESLLPFKYEVYRHNGPGSGTFISDDVRFEFPVFNGIKGGCI